MGDPKMLLLKSQMQSLMTNQPHFPKKLEQYLISQTNNVKNPFEYIATLFIEGVLCDGANNPEPYFGLKEMMIVQLAFKIACSKGPAAICGFIDALNLSGNTQVISALRTWIGQDWAVEANNGGISEVKQDIPQSETASATLTDEATLLPAPVTYDFFQQSANSDELSLVANFNGQPLKSCAKGTLTLEFDNNRMLAHLDDSTVKIWNWVDQEEKTIKLGDKLKFKPGEVITSFQCDGVVAVVGTSVGTVYLFDAASLEEKWSVRLGEPVLSLKFVDSTILIRTSGLHEDFSVENFWWVQISRPEMQLSHLNSQFRVGRGASADFIIQPFLTFVYYSRAVDIYTTERVSSQGQLLKAIAKATALAPAVISTVNMVQLISRKVLVAGCRNGAIAIWYGDNLTSPNQEPFKILKGHKTSVLSVCVIKGHLISLDKNGRLLMWSGFDLVNERLDHPAPRVLAQNFQNVTNLVGYERWLATSSSKDGVINVWTLPDSWLRTG